MFECKFELTLVGIAVAKKIIIIHFKKEEIEAAIKWLLSAKQVSIRMFNYL